MLARLAVGLAVTMADATAAIVYFYAKDTIFGLAQTGGPADAVIDQLEALVPLALLIILLGTWAWIVYGSVQEEKRRGMRRVRR